MTVSDVPAMCSSATPWSSAVRPVLGCRQHGRQHDSRRGEVYPGMYTRHVYPGSMTTMVPGRVCTGIPLPPTMGTGTTMRLMALILREKAEHYAPHGSNPQGRGELYAPHGSNPQGKKESSMRLMALTLRRRRSTMRLMALILKEEKEHYAPHGSNPPKEERRALCASWL